MSIFHRLVKKIALVGAVISLVFSVPLPAKAESGIRYESNGISLNVNPTYGYKHGGIQASQYNSASNDKEQLFNEINNSDGSKLIESQAYPGKCLNIHKPITGSIPNFLPCDQNDDDMKFRSLNGQLYHRSSTLKVDIGSRNDSIVKMGLPIETTLNESNYTPIQTEEITYYATIGAIKATKVNWHHPGHAIFGVTKVTTIFTQGVSKRAVKSQKHEYTTIGANGGLTAPNIVTGQSINNGNLTSVSYPNLNGRDESGVKWDINELSDYFNKGMPNDKGDWTFLTSKIDQSKYESALQSNIGDKINCQYYPDLANVEKIKTNNLDKYCHCADVSIRMFKFVTNSNYFDNIEHMVTLAPDFLYVRIRHIKANDG